MISLLGDVCIYLLANGREDTVQERTVQGIYMSSTRDKSERAQEIQTRPTLVWLEIAVILISDQTVIS